MAKKVAVIGAGPGGYVAAIRLAQLGADVVLVEKDRIGGTCLNRGCIPTKTLFRTAEIMRDCRNREEFGIVGGESKVDFPKLFARKAEVVNTLVGGIEQLIKSYPNIEFISGRAVVESATSIRVEACGADQSAVADQSAGATKGASGSGACGSCGAGTIEIAGLDAIIVANGGHAQMTETEGVDQEGVLTSDTLLELDVLPKRLVVVGAGVIGVEFASIYKELGSEVVMLASRMLKNADGEIQKRIIPLLKKQGIELYNNVRARKIVRNGDMLTVTAANKKDGSTFDVEGDYVLIASGRAPEYDGLDVAALGINTDKGGILVDENFETSAKGIYAIGDIVSGNPQLAHVASAQGECVAELIMGEKPQKNLEIYPNCVFSINEVAHVGATEEELKEAGVEYKVSKFNYAANGKALSMGETAGLLKIIADADGRVIGAHILGAHANDLISECTLAVANGMTAMDIVNTIHAHPTLSEIIAEAAAGVYDQAIHVARPKKSKRVKKE